MAKDEVVVVDYGLGNLASVAAAIRSLGRLAIISSSPQEILQAKVLILPGVGAYPVAMRLLGNSGVGDAVKSAARHGAKVLGICLGMQLLFDRSTEFGMTEGLGLIPGEVRKIVENRGTSAGLQRETHIGWRALMVDGPGKNHQLLDGLSRDASYYFVHSFGAYPERPDHEIASVSYGSTNVAAVCGFENVMGVQFHPEKSGESGLSLLENFLAL